MAHIARSIEVDASVDHIHAQWLRFEERCGGEPVAADVRWRAETLTLEPIPSGTRITLRVQFDPAGADPPGLAARLQRMLDGFLAFAAGLRRSPA